MCSTPVAPDRKRALVTGGTGFVGSNLTRRLLRAGHEVGLLVRPGHDPWRLTDVASELHWIEAGLEDFDGLSAAVADFKPEWVFHLAAYGAYSWQVDTATIQRTNVLCTSNLVEACLRAGFETFVNTGSSSEYGAKDHAPNEDESLEPNSAYAVAKAAATLYCTSVARATGARIATLRLYSAYGPWEEPKRFVPQLVMCGLEGRLPPLANPETARDFVYVEDVCDAYTTVATSDIVPGVVYNVGTGLQTTLRQAVEMARRALSVDAEPDWRSMPDRDWDTQTWVADSARLRDRLGWKPSVDFERGLRLTADWLRHYPELMARYKAASS